MNNELIIKLLSKNPLFSELETSQLEKIVALSHNKSVKKKQIIFHKGEMGSQLYLLLNGQIQISSISDQGKEIILNFIEPGDLFGEISLFDGKDRTATATALKNSELLFINRHDFMTFLEETPKAAINMLAGLSSLIRKTNILLEDMLFRPLSSRLAKNLITLCKDYGEELKNGELRINMTLNQEQLGNMVDSSRESICRQLSVWQADEIIRIDHHHIIIINLEELDSLIDEKSA